MVSLAFIESSFPAYLSRFSDADWFVYSKNASKYSPPNQKIIVVPDFAMRILKVLCSFLRFKCTFQGGYGLAYKIARNKSVISDGILTEWLYKKGYIKPEQFISIDKIEPCLPVLEGKQIIVGNNFYEFGNFTLATYLDYLKQLRSLYPQAYYFPHPREVSIHPENIFGDYLIKTDGNIESYCHRYGVPNHIIGYVGSTAIASIGKLASSNIIIEAIKIPENYCDGPTGNLTDPFLLQSKGIRINLTILEQVVEQILEKVPNVKLLAKNL